MLYIPFLDIIVSMVTQENNDSMAKTDKIEKGGVLSNYDFLAAYQNLQTGIEFDELIKRSSATVSHTAKNAAPYCNFALINKMLSDEEFSELEHLFSSLERTPVIYFENKPTLVKHLDRFKKRGYEKAFEDSWMFYERDVIDKSRFPQVKKVDDHKSLEVFLKTWDASLQSGDPQNPYGSVKGYLDNYRQAWLKFGASNRVQYFIVYDGEQPVATALLHSFEGVGYISNVGSLQTVRGRGFGKLATLYAVKRSQQIGNIVQNFCVFLLIMLD
ncbi:MAG: hypothetical protein UW61_C0040G0007 [Candidatus Curtissbacteria bacterium GW2011_GWC1_44_33]|uniref:N-acetyltransferase domain-containing protein n=1 Tax=Candidatus Curtissbacteria bacterium GW2011_GWC1_44_33 TaxID=1618413 RepID=A0A0G1J321_9BACT|nr:MAG: hypothetical protein UW61_C0040G0007 [Candidatus Curtissbacteria bacterium GW2011_GWC1_44_33]